MKSVDKPGQLPLDIPQARYTLRVTCKCGHSAEMTVGYDVMRNIKKLRCSRCGGYRRDLTVEQLGADLGG